MDRARMFALGQPAFVNVTNNCYQLYNWDGVVNINRFKEKCKPYKRGITYIVNNLTSEHIVRYCNNNFAKVVMEKLSREFVVPPDLSELKPDLYEWQRRTLAFIAAAESRTTFPVRFPDQYVPPILWRTHTVAYGRELPSTSGKTTDGFESGILHSTCKAHTRDECIIHIPPFTATVACDAPGGLLASDVGTGKTAVLLQRILDTKSVSSKTLIVVPNSLEGQWVCEMKRVWGDRYWDGDTKKQHARNNSRHKEAESDESSVKVWRCCTLTQYWKPPAKWDVLLTTFEFISARVKESITQVNEAGKSLVSKVYPRPIMTPQWAQDMVEKEAYPSLLMDIHWDRLIVDEAEDALAKMPQCALDFLEDLPCRHVWLMTATPSNYAKLARLMRLRLASAVIDTNDPQSEPQDIARILLKYDVAWQDSAVANGCAFRVTKADTVDTQRTRINTRTIDIVLSQEERQVLDYLRQRGRNINDALVCTDIDSFLQEALASLRTDESRVMTMDDFWAQMRSENAAEGQEVDEKLDALRLRLEELASIKAALPEHCEEWRRVRDEIKAVEKRYERQQAERQKVASSDAFLKNLNDRIEDAQNNPCSICADDIEDGKLAITVCGHVFCIDCLKSWLDQNSMCPMCRKRPLLMSDVTVVDSLAAPAAAPQKAPRKYSTKIDFLLAHLRNLFATTDDKVIVFTHYAPTLRKIYNVLKAEGIAAARMTGNVHGKNANMIRFKGADVNECRVMLLDTVHQNSGMDLIQANHVIFLDTHAVSADAFTQGYGRCARLGQRKDINLTFFRVPQYENTGGLTTFLDGLSATNQTTTTTTTLDT